MLHLAIAFFFSTTSFMDLWISSCNIDLDPATCGGGRRPRSTVDGGRSQRSAKGRDAIDGGRRPASGRVEPAEHEPVQRGASGQKSAPSTRPCVFRRLYAPAAPCCFPAAPCAMPWRFCDLPKYPAASTTNRNRFLSLTSLRYFWAQEQQPFPDASQRRSLPGNAHPAPISPYTSTSLSRPL